MLTHRYALHSLRTLALLVLTLILSLALALAVAASGSEIVIGANEGGGTDADDGTPDEFRIVRNGAELEVYINGGFTSAFAYAGLNTLQFQGSGDDDTLVVDFGAGNPIPVGGLFYDGGGEMTAEGDGLVLEGNSLENSTYTPTGLKSGTLVFDGTWTLSFSDLEPVLDLVPGNLTVNGTNGDNAITYVQGSDATRGLVSVDAYETVEFSIKTDLVLYGLAGSDDIVLNNASAPTGLISITVNGGTGDDIVDVYDVGSGVTGPVTLDGDAGDDQFKVKPSASAVVSVDGGDHIIGDVLVVDPMGSTAVDTGSAVLVTGFEAVQYTNVETVIIQGLGPDLSIIKADNPDPIYAGQDLYYDLTVTNNSDYTTATGVVVTDTLPTAVTYLAATTGCDASNLPELVCALDDLAPGSSRTFQIATRVASDAVATESDGTRVITNTAQVTMDNSLADPSPANNTVTEGTFVQDLADLRITKLVEPEGTVRAGQIFTYTIWVDNLGPSAARNVVISDTLLSSGKLSIQSCVFSVSQGGGAITQSTCTTGSLVSTQFGQDVGEFRTNYLYPITAPSQGRLRGSFQIVANEDIDVTNTVRTASKTPDPDMSNNFASASISVLDTANLSISKQASGEAQVQNQPGLVFDITTPNTPFPQGPNYATSPDQVTAGRRISYTLTIANAGPSGAENVVVSDRLPPGVTIYPGSLTASQGSCETGTPGEPLDRMTCGLGTISSEGSATITFQVLVDPSLAPGSVLGNDVLVTSDTFDPSNDDNHAHTLTAVETWADMAITKLSVGENVTGYDAALRRFVFEDLAGQVTAGRELRYEITVQNNGASDAQNVQILDLLPGQTDTGLDHDPLTFLRSEGAICRPADELQELGIFGPGAGQGKFGQWLWCDLGTVPAGVRHTFDIYVAVDSAVPDGTTLTNGAFVWWGASSPPAQPSSFSGFPFPQIPPELPTTDDPYLDNNFADTDTDVNAVADVWIEEVDEPAEARLDRESEPDLAIAGEEHRYLLSFGNDGPSVAGNIAVQDFLDFQQFGVLGEHFVRCEPFDFDDFVACSETNGVVDVDLLLKQNEQVIPGDLNPDDEFKFWLITEVDAGYVLDADDFVATNDSRITATSTDFHTANNVDAHDTEIIGEADLIIEKASEYVRTPISDPVEAEGMITYTLNVWNNGPSDAAEVFVVDWLPSEGVFLDPAYVQVFVSTGQVVEIRDDGRITVRLGNDPNNAGTNELGRMNAGSAETVSIVVLVRNDVQIPTVINRARVETRQNDAEWPPAPDLLPGVGGGLRAPTADPDPGNNEDSNEVALQGLADLRIAKFGKPDDQARAGQYLTYTIVVDNLGPGYANSVVIKDLFQSDGSFELVAVDSDRPAICTPESGSFGEQLQLVCELSDPLEALTADTPGRWIVTVVVRADEAQSINNLARVTSEDFDPNLEDNEAIVEHQITDVADLQISKVARGQVMAPGGATSLEADQVTVGYGMTYTLVITNNGPSTAENVVLKDRVPPLLEITGIAASQGSCAIGTPGEESNLVTCNLDSLASGASAAVHLFVDVPPSTPVGTVLTNSAFALSGVFDAHNGDNVATNMTSVSALAFFRAYLPRIVSSPPRALPDGPDLFVRQIQAASYGITLTIENRGNEPVSDPFWVDVYINPASVPDAAQQIWSELGGQGLVWGIPDDALPILPGEIRSLSVGDAAYWPSLSYAAWPLLSGTPVYAQVDSLGEHEHGAVQEGHEVWGGFYNNISGPISVEASAGSVPAQGIGARILSGLPPRR